MSIKKQIVVTDWTKNKPKGGSILKLTLSSDQRRNLRGRRVSDCNQEIILQLPRQGRLNDGDLLVTNNPLTYIKIIARKENLIEINSNSQIELIKTAYHLGNRHVEVQICKDALFTKSNYLIEDMLKNFKVKTSTTQKKFFPEIGAHNHE